MVSMHPSSYAWKTFQDPIMAERVPCFQLGFGFFDFLNVENSNDVKSHWEM